MGEYWFTDFGKTKVCIEIKTKKLKQKTIKMNFKTDSTQYLKASNM